METYKTTGVIPIIKVEFCKELRAVHYQTQHRLHPFLNLIEALKVPKPVLLLAKAEPISVSDSACGITEIKRKKKPVQLQPGKRIKNI